MESLRTPRTSVLLILLLAFTLRFVAGLWWQQRLGPETDFFFGDSSSYWYLARSLAAGERYEFAGSQVFRAPGYPVLLAGLFLLDPDPPIVWARSLGALLGMAAVGGVIVLARQLFDRPTALLAGVLATIYPGAIGMSVFVLSEAPFCPLMLGQLSAWAAADRSQETRSWLLFGTLGGVFAGIATLTRPSWLLLTPLGACLALLGGRRNHKQIGIALTMLAAMSVTMAPWWIRNFVVTRSFVPTTLEVGASLYDGLNPDADGSSDMQFVDDFRAQLEKAPPMDRSDVADEVRLSRAMRDAAIAWARDHPRRVFQLALLKFQRIWSPLPNAEELRGQTFRWLTAMGYVPLLLASLWGVWVYRYRWTTWMCLLPAVYFTALHVVFVGSIRYRQPAMLVLTVLAAAAMMRLGGMRRVRHRGSEGVRE